MERSKKDLITLLKEIETNVELSIGKTMTEDLATDIYALTNELICDVNNIKFLDKKRDLYQELRMMGLSSDNCSVVSDWVLTLMKK